MSWSECEQSDLDFQGRALQLYVHLGRRTLAVDVDPSYETVEHGATSHLYHEEYKFESVCKLGNWRRKTTKEERDWDSPARKWPRTFHKFAHHDLRLTFLFSSADKSWSMAALWMPFAIRFCVFFAFSAAAITFLRSFTSEAEVWPGDCFPSSPSNSSYEKQKVKTNKLINTNHAVFHQRLYIVS